MKPGDELPGGNPREMLEQFQASVFGAPYLNDLEPPAFEVAPELKALRDELQTFGFAHVMMSGSGSTIFCVGPPGEAHLDTWRDALKEKYDDVEVYEQSFCRRPDDETLWYDE